MSNFFNPTTTRTQPARQEGVVDTLRPPVIEGYTFDNNSLATSASIGFAANAATTGTFPAVVTVNPAYQAFTGQNVRTVNIALIAGDTLAIQASKLRAALLGDLLLSAYFNITVSAGTVSITAKQTYEPTAFLTAISLSGAAITVGAAPVSLPLGAVGRLVYTPSVVSGSVIRTIEAGATGVLRGMTAWCPDVEYNDITKSSTLRPFYYHDVLSSGIINVDGVAPVTTYASAPNSLFVYVTGVNAGRIRVGSDTNAIALTAANFPGIANLANCQFSVYELSFAGSSLYKLRVEIN